MLYHDERIKDYLFDDAGNDFGNYEVYENNGVVLTVWYPYELYEEDIPIHVHTKQGDFEFEQSQEEEVIERIKKYLEGITAEF